MNQKIRILTRSGDIGFCVAEKNRYYEESGIRVEIDTKLYSVKNIEGISSDRHVVGVADFVNIIKANLMGKKVCAVLGISSGVFGTAVRLESGIEQLKGLEGHRMAMAKGGGEFIAFPFLASRAGFDPSKVQHVDSPVGTGPTMLVKERSVDAFTGYTTAEVQNCVSLGEQERVPMAMLRHSDYLDYYNSAVVVNRELIDEDPKLVKGFTMATQKGFSWAIDHPQEAAAIRATAVPGYFDIFESPVKVARAHLNELIRSSLRWEVWTYGMGWMLQSKVEALRNAYNSAGILGGDGVQLEGGVYTNQFLERGVVPEKLATIFE